MVYSKRGPLWADLVWKRNNIEQHEESQKKCLHEGEDDVYQDKGEGEKCLDEEKVEGEEVECMLALDERRELG